MRKGTVMRYEKIDRKPKVAPRYLAAAQRKKEEAERKLQESLLNYSSSSGTDSIHSSSIPGTSGLGEISLGGISLGEIPDNDGIKENVKTYRLKERKDFQSSILYEKYLILEYIRGNIDEFPILIIPYHWEEMMIDWEDLKAHIKESLVEDPGKVFTDKYLGKFLQTRRIEREEREKSEREILNRI